MSIKNLLIFATGFATGSYAMYKFIESNIDSPTETLENCWDQENFKKNFDKAYKNIFDCRNCKSEDDIHEDSEDSAGGVSDSSRADDNQLGASSSESDRENDSNLSVSNNIDEVSEASNQATDEVVIPDNVVLSPELDDESNGYFRIFSIDLEEFLYHKMASDCVMEFSFDRNSKTFERIRTKEPVTHNTMIQLIGDTTVANIINNTDNLPNNLYYSRDDSTTNELIYISITVI